MIRHSINTNEYANFMQPNSYVNVFKNCVQPSQDAASINQLKKNEHSTASSSQYFLRDLYKFD